MSFVNSTTMLPPFKETNYYLCRCEPLIDGRFYVELSYGYRTYIHQKGLERADISS
ncbi:unnamed protein product [Prunus brigantina]